MPNVSVVIPSFNRWHYTLQAVESVLCQTYRDFEVIIVDNGSTDSVPGSLANLRGSQIRVFRLDPNQGRSTPRNVGIREARGKYIAFLDSDDVWYPQKLQEQIPLLDENPEIGLVHSFSEAVDGEGRILAKENRKRLALYRKAVRRGYTYEQMSLRCILFTSTIVARKQVLEEIGGYDTSMPILEDWDMYLRLALISRIATVETVLAKYRRHDNHTTDVEHVLGRINACHKHLKLIEDHPQRPWDRESRRNFMLQLASAYYVRGQSAQCAHWMRAAVKIDPQVIMWPQFLGCSLAAFTSGKFLEQMRNFKRTATKYIVSR